MKISTVIGLFIVLVYVLLAIGGEWIAPYSYTEQHFADVLQPPSFTYWLGTDQFGRDIFSRIIVGSRTMLLLATGSTVLALVLGGLIGLLAGYLGNWFDEVLMRLTDIMLSFPALLLALLIVSTLGSEMAYLILTIAIVFVPNIARVVRSEVLGLRHKEFIEAALAIGATDRRIIVYHILPNVSRVMIVEGSIYFGYAILVGAGLGFLGMGVQPPSPDWGLQINEGRNFLPTAPWIAIFPSLAITSLVVGVNLLADGLGHK